MSIKGYKTDLGKYMEAEVTEIKPKTLVWTIRNKRRGTVLGQIKWLPQWRQYCFFSEKRIFSESCQTEIINFLKTIKLKVRLGN